MIWAMVLAAGESKRMGYPKLLLPFNKKTIIETVLTRIINSKAEKILVVLGANKEKIEKKIKDYPVKISVNSDFHKGMLSSVQHGFRVLPDNAQAVLVMLGDQPSIPSQIIDKIIEAFRRTQKGIVLPLYKKDRGHPVLIDMKYQDEVQRLNPEFGLRALVYSHPEDILEVEVKSPAILKDIDYRADYSEERQQEILISESKKRQTTK